MIAAAEAAVAQAEAALNAPFAGTVAAVVSRKAADEISPGTWSESGAREE